MGSLRFNEYADSPTIFLPPQAHKFNTTSHPTTASSHYQTYQTIMPDTPANAPQVTPSTTLSSLTTNLSRKRSREEEPEADNELLMNSTPMPVVSPEPIYGEGMVLINPSTGVSTSAESQTGTWYEDKLEAEALATLEVNELAAAHATERSVMPMRKCQRRDTSSTLDSSDTGHSHASDLSKLGPDEPVVDHFTHLLGVGWARVSTDPDIQAAARGYAKYIENHYPLNTVAVVLKSRGLDAYLVQEAGGFYLFKEDLSEGQLVGSDWEKCLSNLQRAPMVFEGVETLKAVRTPELIPMVSAGACESGPKSMVEVSQIAMEDCYMDLS